MLHGVTAAGSDHVVRGYGFKNKAECLLCEIWRLDGLSSAFHHFASVKTLNLNPADLD
jgi:hypothetical protein